MFTVTFMVSLKTGIMDSGSINWTGSSANKCK